MQYNKIIRRGFTQEVVQNCYSKLNSKSHHCLRLKVRSRIKYGMTPLFNNGGFTLIELLVVVLIIGILVAITLPQYNKVVLKSRLSQAQLTLHAIVEAEHAYFLANGSYAPLPSAFLDLNISVPNLWITEVTVGSDEVSSFSVYSNELVVGGIGFYYLPDSQQYFCAAESSTDGSALCQSFNTQKADCVGIAKDDELECWYFN